MQICYFVTWDDMYWFEKWPYLPVNGNLFSKILEQAPLIVILYYGTVYMYKSCKLGPYGKRPHAIIDDQICYANIFTQSVEITFQTNYTKDVYVNHKVH